MKLEGGGGPYNISLSFQVFERTEFKYLLKELDRCKQPKNEISVNKVFK